MATFLASLLLGCQTTAPISLWQPPQLVSVSGESIVLMEIAGPQKTAEGLRQELLQITRPNEGQSSSATGNSTSVTFLLPDQLPDESTIRLVSAVENEPSDLAIAAAARRSGLRYLMRGEIMHATGNPRSEERLSVVWKLVGLDADCPTEGMPISVNQQQISLAYPDLMAISDPHVRLQKAMVRKTLGLLNQSVIRKTVTLAEPRYALGSRAVREGNVFAQHGNWPAAEEIWVQTLESHPGQVGAWINASIAAAARQDFPEAKQRITRAIQLSAFSPVNRTLAKETLVWLELQQRDYHEAFGLPDPPGGWRVTHRDETMATQND
ncbi:tetratricopeptide repeat protein [Rhodopirellula sp. SWK7]|uniref:tetratricopeptide repeat protein n=1 Tax=Rhodopirellula sp. SWK7 TaxID=595460 RepID=UPI001F255AEA|nr:hypothetical protein [Rhodopirellula sp. SWK7]